MLTIESSTQAGTVTGGTVDPDTGAFVFHLPESPVNPFPFQYRCTDNPLTGTPSADRTTLSGLWSQGDPTFHGCVNTMGPFTGVRTVACGDRAVDGDEECDDGNTTDGDCCSSACRFESAGAACDDHDVCTVGDACDGAGTCAGPGRAACAPCETCNSSTGCVAGPEPACTTLPGRATLSLDLDRRTFAFAARAGGLAFRDPVRSTDYGLCVFTGAGGSWTPLVSAHVPAGGRCDAKACWTAAGSGPRYRNPARTPDGLSVVRLRRTGPSAGAAVLGGGRNLRVAGPLPSTLDVVRVQLRGTDGAGAVCFASDLPDLDRRWSYLLRARR